RIASPAHRVNQLLVETLVDPCPQPAYVTFHDVCLRIEMKVPHRFQQHGPGNDLAGMAHQILEKTKLAGLEIDDPAGTTHRPCPAVELKICYAKAGRGSQCVRPPPQSGDARDQLTERERLDQVVVSAGIESRNAIANAAQRGQKQNWRRYRCTTEGLHKLQRVQHRQHSSAE